MISRLHRFHGHNALHHAYRHGQIQRGPFFAIKYVLNGRRQAFRVAVVVSRKVCKSAVVRNRIRRRIYETFRLHADSISAPYDIVITVFDEEVALFPNDKLSQSLATLLRRAGILP